MPVRRKIIANDAFFYAPDRLSPGVGAIRLFPEQNRIRQALAWTRWWHWAALALAALLVIDAHL